MNLNGKVDSPNFFKIGGDKPRDFVYVVEVVPVTMVDICDMPSPDFKLGIRLRLLKPDPHNK